MKILHILTLITPDGAYGGPSRVAVNQASTLQDSGHDVVIAAGCAGFEVIPTELGGVPVRLFPAKRLVRRFGYAPTYARQMRKWLAKHLDEFDVVHIHLARDLVTAPASVQVRNKRVPFVVQTHGMVIQASHPLANLFDRVYTARILKRASRILYLNAREKLDLERIGAKSGQLLPLANGIPAEEFDMIMSGAAKSTLPEVLFFARLHPRKRPAMFAEAAVALLRVGTNASFVVVGPPEGAEASVDEIIESARLDGIDAVHLRRECGVPLDAAYDRIAQASVLVLPSRIEPFGMAIVEALALGIPVVVSNDGGLAEFVERHDCGITVEANAENLAEAISKLLSDLPGASDMGRRGMEGVRAEFNMNDIGKSLEAIYQDSIFR